MRFQTKLFALMLLIALLLSRPNYGITVMRTGAVLNLSASVAMPPAAPAETISPFAA